VIVGVVGDVHQYGLELKPDRAVYLPLAQVDHPSQGWTSLVVRSDLPSAQMISAVDAAMAAVDPLQPVFHLQPMTTYVALSVSQRTFALQLMTAIGVLALTMATAGAYSVVSYIVVQRNREVALRLALGATPADMLWMLARQVLLTASIGVFAGWVLAAWLTKGVSALLFNVGRFDIETTCGVAGVLIGATLVAAAAPIARAVRVDPMVVLRSE
jgi:ABC-type antimicrobial peptide transport system permease subunit